MSDEAATSPKEKSFNWRNPFLVALWTPVYLLGFAICFSTDMLWVVLYLILTLGLLFAYVTEFEILPGLYPNEVIHKVAVSSLVGIVSGFMIGIAIRSMTGVDEGTDTGGTISGAKYMGLTWMLTSVPGYLLCVWRISTVNKRDHEEEHRARMEKRQNRKKSSPPILNKYCL